VIQDEWDAPVCGSWVSRLAGTLERADRPVVLAAHSAGCALVAH
jgi:predicted alpha/beta hydrolase family esterase